MNSTPYQVHFGTAKIWGYSRQKLERGNWHNFSIFALRQQATLEIRDAEGKQKIGQFNLDPIQNRTGDVWHIAIDDLPDSFSYAWCFDSNPLEMVCDPFAQLLAGEHLWGQGTKLIPESAAPERSFALVSQSREFDWQGDRPPNLPLSQIVLYEAHVRGFTQHETSQSPTRGVFAAFCDKLPYLKWLGVTSIELLPIFEFSEIEYQRNDLNGRPLCNFWGYSTLHFCTLMRAFAYPATSLQARDEFKELVRRAHALDMEIVLDVVYNHTGEGNELGPTLSFKGLARECYYLLNPDNSYTNHTGCGNTFNANHPAGIDLIITSLRHFVIEYHVDGFRFDLCTLLMRTPENRVDECAPVLRAIAQDPVLANVKLIAEPWDPSGTYRVGNFPFGNRFCEWNDRFRDDVRRFVNFGQGKGAFSSRLCGSQDLFHGRAPHNSLNFITCHDGFSLCDLVSYSQKHNEANAEENRDGNNNNVSWNCGVEGPTDEHPIRHLRDKQVRNFLLALILSQGTPMLLSGDEYGHTKGGNNNSWCQDGPMSWFRWDLTQSSSLPRFVRHLIQLRKSTLPLNDYFLDEKNAIWHGSQPNKPLWEKEDGLIALTLQCPTGDLYLAFNASGNAVEFTLPTPKKSQVWALSINTAQVAPADFCEVGSEKIVTSPSLQLEDHSAILLLSKPVESNKVK